MDFQTAVRTCLQKYATFTGRARRSEFWWFALFVFAGSLILGFVDSLFFSRGQGMYMGPGLLEGLFGLAMLLPSIGVGVRRMHDQDRTGWWLLLYFVPVLGWLIMLFFYIQPGTPGHNRFGPDPLGSGGALES